DPSRPTTMAQLASLPTNSPHNQITDVVSYNIYYGWYKGVIEDNEAFLDAFHKTYPDKAMGISEYGVDNLICWHSAEPFNHDYTEEYACLYHRHMLSVFAARPWLWATHMWNMFDFAADRRAEGGIKGRNCKGLVTYDRKTRKDTFYLYKAFWTKDPCVYVAGRRFANRAPKERTVRVFTNAPEVSLYLNGTLYATAKAEACEAVFPEVPLLDGENTVTARIVGAEDSIPLYGVPEHDSSYDLPDVAEALQMGNWFLEEDESKDYGEEGFGLHCKMKEIAMNEEACHIMRGWVMSSPNLAIGEKLHVMSRLTLWVGSAPGEKTPRQIKVFAAKCTEEEFATLDKRLRSVKRT
ncbi:MAG: beta-galactosidase, partial [Clostridia bacterium]|nr:beta-galactosidase [Clostridia bacterium]